MSHVNGFVTLTETGLPSRVIIFTVCFFSTVISLQGAVHQKRRKCLFPEVKKKKTLRNRNVIVFSPLCLQLHRVQCAKCDFEKYFVI